MTEVDLFAVNAGIAKEGSGSAVVMDKSLQGLLERSLREVRTFGQFAAGHLQVTLRNHEDLETARLLPQESCEAT